MANPNPLNKNMNLNSELQYGYLCLVIIAYFAFYLLPYPISGR